MDTLYIFLSSYAQRKNGDTGIGISYQAVPGKEPIYEEALYAGPETKNSAVYKAVERALARASDWGFAKVRIYTDKRLAASQLGGNLVKNFSKVEVKDLEKAKNSRSRQMAKAASLAGPESVTSQAIQWTVGPGITGLVLAFTPKLMICQFKYKKGSKIPAHKHYHEQGSYIQSGSLKYTVADREVILGRGSALVITGNAVHSNEALADTTEIATYAPLRWDLIKQ